VSLRTRSSMPPGIRDARLRGILVALIVLAVAATVFAWLSAGGGGPEVTVSPLPGTRDASPQTQISFLGVPAARISDVSVVGTKSGAHAGHLQAYSTGTGASFLLARPLAQGEHVHVSARVAGRHVATDFDVARWVSYTFRPFPRTPASSQGTVQSFASAPSLHPPTVQVTTRSRAATPGDVFVGPNQGAGQWGPMIFDETGQLVWFRPMAAGTYAMNLQVQNYDGSPHLVWWQGHIFDIGIGYGTDEIYDTHYRKVAQIQAGNGYQADLHEVAITPQNTAFITTDTLVQADLSAEGGAKNGILLDPIVQEIDIKTGLVMFEWDALGHVSLHDSFSKPGSASLPWDWFHLNSVSLGPHGDILVGSRNTWAAYDVNLANGQVLWRLGGKHPSFAMGPGTKVAYQHDAEWQPDGTITLFDNGASPAVHPQSRAIRVRVDMATHSVSLVRELEHTPAVVAASQGNHQALAGGQSFVGWGQDPHFTEFSPSGETLFDARFPDPGQSYRAYLFPWSGTPSSSPALAVKATGTGTATVAASWNGATSVAAWRVLSGPDQAHLATVTQAAKSGFETAIPVSTSGRVLAVQALASGGQVLATSPPVPLSR
jgi:Arylsulfotransferase (ASST)